MSKLWIVERQHDRFNKYRKAVSPEWECVARVAANSKRDAAMLALGRDWLACNERIRLAESEADDG